MAKQQSVYVCQECGTQYTKWIGRCSECNMWNSVVEEILDQFSFANAKKRSGVSVVQESEIFILDGQDDAAFLSTKRHDIGVNEFNRVLGGGMVEGSTILLSGEPGVGKSTLLLQLCNKAANNGFRCFYISGEESASQIKLRAMRLGVASKNNNIKLATATSLNSIINIIKKLNPPALVIIDSIQTLYSEDINSAPGTVSQVRACTFELIKVAKRQNISLIIVGHITKDGQIAGPKVLEHMVDTVLHFEGEGVQQYRIIRTIKNRYGSTNEIGVFEMSNSGLSEVTNPSKLFMSHSNQEVSGACVFAGIEGSRSILVEIQSLVASSFLPTPRRAAIGWDSNRLAMMIAILNARYGLNLTDKEVYLNVAGGLKIIEPAVDLPVIASLISAAKGTVIPRDIALFGEVGLSGELRQVVQVESRINEAIKLGFKQIIMPKDGKKYDDSIEFIQIEHINELSRVLSQNRLKNKDNKMN